MHLTAVLSLTTDIFSVFCQMVPGIILHWGEKQLFNIKLHDISAAQNTHLLENLPLHSLIYQLVRFTSVFKEQNCTKSKETRRNH